MIANYRQQIGQCYRRLGEAGLGTGRSGNVSLRFEDGMLVTPSGARPETLSPGEVVEMSLDGEAFQGEGKPSSEWRMHAELYLSRPDARAIVHCHSRYATILACAHQPLPALHYMIASAGCRSIPLAPYATFGSRELAQQAVVAMGQGRACLLANHGQIALGATLEEALALAVDVEELAALHWGALQIGGPVILDDAEMARVEEAFKSYGQ